VLPLVGADLCGCPEGTVPGEVGLLLVAAVPAAAGEEDETEESGCRSLAVRIRHGAGEAGCCFLLEARQSPGSSSSSSSTSSATEAAAGGGAVGPLSSRH
jgi:hypothetical protein